MVLLSALSTASDLLLSRECRKAARVQAPKSNIEEVGRGGFALSRDRQPSPVHGHTGLDTSLLFWHMLVHFANTRGSCVDT